MSPGLWLVHFMYRRLNRHAEVVLCQLPGTPSGIGQRIVESAQRDKVVVITMVLGKPGVESQPDLIPAGIEGLVELTPLILTTRCGHLQRPLPSCCLRFIHAEPHHLPVTIAYITPLLLQILQRPALKVFKEDDRRVILDPHIPRILLRNAVAGGKMVYIALTL